MNYDDFQREVRRYCNVVEVSQLDKVLSDWKTNSATVNDLSDLVDEFFLKARLETDLQKHLSSTWSDFRRTAIDGIEGMTMNERLHYFGLFDRFEASSTESGKSVVYSKLLAKPK